MPDVVFPEGFLWGASTSAHQVEGGNSNNDWWAWEQAGRAKEPSGTAADSWNRYGDDLDIAESMGLTAVRLSVEWSRIEPEPGRFSEEAVAHYAEVLADAKARGLQTMLVLWHFTSPAWLAERGGWTWCEAPVRFADYAAFVASRVGHLVDHWVTVNEANTYVWRGYIRGDWPPGRTSAWPAGYTCYRRLAQAHRLARQRIRAAIGEGTPVGLAHVMAWPHPAEHGGGFSTPMIALWNLLANDLFLDMVASDLDWLGVQYYHDSPAKTFSIANEDGGSPRTDLGWRIVPKGLYEVVMRASRRYRVPIIVTENGLADALDVQRGRFIVDHLAWLAKAIEDGADVRGYLHWSLIDNFEWGEGFGPRFGLCEVDYRTLERHLRPSGALFGRIVACNGVPDGLGRELVYSDGTGPLGPNG